MGPGGENASRAHEGVNEGQGVQPTRDLGYLKFEISDFREGPYRARSIGPVDLALFHML